MPNRDDISAEQTAPSSAPGKRGRRTSPSSTAWRVTKRLLYGVGKGLGVIVLLIIMLLLLLQTNWGADKAKNLILSQLTIFDGAELQVERLGGTFLTSLAIYNANLVTNDGTRLAHIDTVEVRYRLWPLLSQTVHFRDAYVAGPELTMTQQADSSWDVFNVLPPGDTTATEVDTSSSAWQVVIDRLLLNEGRATAAFYAPGRDSTFRLKDLYVDGRDAHFGDELGFMLDALRLQSTPPGSPDAVHLRMGATLAKQRFMLTNLRLQSPRSRVTGQGTLLLPQSEDDRVEDIDFTLEAAPLAFHDLHPFVSTLAPQHSATLNVRVQGAAHLVNAEADARFSDGGTLALTATATPTTADSVRYRLDGQIRRLDPGLFAGQSAAASGQVNADVQVDLAGPALDRLDGTMRALVFDTFVGDYAPERTTLQGAFTDGQAQIDLTTGLRDARLQVEGTIRPFDEQPRYDLRSHIENLDVGQFTSADAAEGGASLSSNLNGTLRLQGNRFDVATADLVASLILEPSMVNQYRLEEGHLDARLASGALDVETAFRFPEGHIAAKGKAHLGEELSYTIEQGQFDRVNVAALVGDTTRSVLTGTLSLRGRGTDLATLRIEEARLELAESLYGPYQLQQASANGTLRDGQITLTANARLDGGAFEVALTGRPFDDQPRLRVTRGAFQEVNLGALMQRPDQRTNLNGTFSAAMQGTDPATMHLDAALSLDPSQLNQQAIDRASIQAQLQRGALTFDTELRLPEGAIQLAGNGRLFDDIPSYTLSEGAFTGLNLGAFLGLPDWQTELNGSLSLTGRGTDPATMALVADLNLDPSRINDESLRDGQLEADLDNGQGRFGMTATLEQGQAQLTTTGRFFDDQPTYEATGSLSDISLARLAGIDTLDAHIASLSFEAAGTGTDLTTMTMDGAVRLSGAHYDDIAIQQLAGSFSLDDALVRVDTLQMQSNVAHAGGSGQVALLDEDAQHASDLAFEATITDLAPLRSVLGADRLSLDEGRLEGRIYGPPGTLRFDASAELNALVYNDMRMAGLDGTMAGTLDRERTLTAGEVNARMDFFSVPTLTVENTTVEAAYQEEQVDFETEMTIDERRDAHMAGTVDLRPDNQRMLITDLNLRFDKDQWELLQDASILYGDEYRVRNFLIYADDQQIALDGVVDFDGDQSLLLTIEQFRMNALADLFGFEGLGGAITGSLDLTGPAESPRVGGRLNMAVRSFGEPVGDLRLDVDYDSLKLNLDAQLAHEDASTLTLNGYLPLDLRLSEGDAETERGVLVGTGAQQDVSLAVEADAFSVGWALPFFDPALVNELDGKLTAHLDVSGTLDQPDLDGQATLIDGRFGLTEYRVVYRNIRAMLELTDNRVVVDNIELESGSGSVVGEGTVNLSELTLGEFDITLKANNFLAVNSREYRTVIDGNVELVGTTNRPQVRGDVQLVSGDIYLTEETSSEEFEPVQLTEADLRMLEQRFGIRVTEADTTTFDFYAAASIALDIEIERDVWLRSRKNPEMNIQFTGELEFQKERNGIEQIFGTINVIPERSFITQFGRRFDIDGGTLTFNGPATDPLLDITARYNVRSRSSRGNEVSITLSLKGHLDDLDTQLTSEPAMPMTDIVSYIAFGRPAGETFLLGGGGRSGGNNELVGQAAGLALNQVTSLFESLGSSELGLDVIEIRQEGLQGATITAGKYVSRRLYVSVSQPISISSSGSRTSSTGLTGNTQFTLEYELFEWLLARYIRDGSANRFKLLWDYAY